jgi:hypothetical protein
MHRRIALLLIVLAVCSTIVWSQGTTSRITGLVSDKSGAVVGGANVTVTNEGTNTSSRATSGDGGFYVVDSLQIGTYTVSVEAKGFKKFVSTGNVLSIGAPTTVNAALEVGTAGETVEVKGGYDLIQTDTSGNFGTVIDNASLTQLPIVGVRGRNPLNLVTLIPGVQDAGLSTGGGTSVHGSRDRAWNYTLDGIDSNETSAGGSQLSPTRQNPDSLSEFRVLTGSFTAEYGRNSGGQITMVTKSGTNDIHGNGFWFYQSPFLNANNPDVKASQLAKNAPNIRPQFVQNIYGGSVGGPIIKNKTFFFANVQLLHALNSTFLTRNVYTDSAKKGLFRYVVGGTNGASGSNKPSVDANGNVLPGLNIGTYDIVANDPLKIGLDPAVQKFLALAPSANNFTVGDGLNIAGYSFTAPQLEKQVDLTFKIDHTINANQSVFVRWASGHQNTIGDTANSGSPRFPGLPDAVDTLRSPRNLAINWHWNPTPMTTNEFVVGMNRFGFVFDSPSASSGASTPFVLNNSITNPLLTAGGNTRVLTTYQLVDNFTLAKGAHTYRWGVNLRYTRHIDHRYGIGSLNALPQVKFDITTNAVDLTTFKVPPTSGAAAINATDSTTLQNAINDLLGRIGKIEQGYAAQDLNTFKPAGSFNLIDSRWPEYDFYGQDSWKIRRNITIDLGLRLEARLAPYLTNFPNLVPNQPVAFGLVPSGNLQWVKGDFYHNDWNNLGPSIGIAWDPFEDGKTSIRANYRLAYDRINTFSFSSTVFQGMPGLTYQITDTSLGPGGLRAKDWRSPAPTKTPGALTLLDPYSVNSITVADPNMRTPKVNMWGLSIQREIARNTVFSLTYNGRHGVGLYGGYDANQVNYTTNGFLDAFNTVRAGGQSPLFDLIFSKDSRTKLAGETGAAFARRNYKSFFDTGSVAGLALAISQRFQGTPGVPLLVADAMPANFFQPYPQVLGALNVLDTRDYSIYHGMEAQVERRFSNGLLFQFSFTWSKSEDTRSYDPTFTTVAQGSSQSAAATPFDNRNPRLNWGPSDFDHTRVWQSNWVYELPFGKSKRWGNSWNRAIDQIIGGWEVAGNFIWESGRPITLYAGSTVTGSFPGATFSSDTVTPLSCFGNCDPYLGHAYFDNAKAQPQQYFFNFQPFDSATNCATSTDGKTKLCIPGPGQFSNIGRNYFRQGIFANLNATIAKTFQVTEHQSLQARLEMQNVTNSQMYDTFGSQNLQSGVFMRLNPASDGVLVNSPRRMQLSLKYTF